MIKRVLLWVVFAFVLWGGWVAVSKWRSPWSIPTSSVLSSLPVSGPACGENCK